MFKISVLSASSTCCLPRNIWPGLIRGSPAAGGPATFPHKDRTAFHLLVKDGDDELRLLGFTAPNRPREHVHFVSGAPTPR